MADLSIPNDFVADTDATAEDVNENFDVIEAAYNGSIASILADNSSSGRIIVCNGSGVPQYVAMSGDATISNAGVLTLAANSVDSAEIAANAVGASEIGSLPAVRVRRTASQNIPDDTLTAVLFDTGNADETFDTDSMHSLASNSERITFTTAGLYLIQAFVFWEPDSSGRREAYILEEGSTLLVASTITNPPAGAPTYQTLSCIYKAAASSYATFGLWQTSGSGLNAMSSTYVTAHWLGDG